MTRIKGNWGTAKTKKKFYKRLENKVKNAKESEGDNHGKRICEVLMLESMNGKMTEETVYMAADDENELSKGKYRAPGSEEARQIKEKARDGFVCSLLLLLFFFCLEKESKKQCLEIWATRLWSHEGQLKNDNDGMRLRSAKNMTKSARFENRCFQRAR